MLTAGILASRTPVGAVALVIHRSAGIRLKTG